MGSSIDWNKVRRTAKYSIRHTDKNWQPNTASAADVNPNYSVAAGPAKQPGPSVFSRVIDLLSRANYTVAQSVQSRLDAVHEDYDDKLQGKNFIEKMGLVALTQIDPRQIDDAAKGAWGGFSGKEKTTFADVLDKESEVGGYELNPWVKGGLGLTLDIGLDPTTYIGVGAVKNAANVVKGGAKVLKGGKNVEEAEEVVRHAAGKGVDEQLQMFNDADLAEDAFQKGPRQVQLGPEPRPQTQGPIPGQQTLDFGVPARAPELELPKYDVPEYGAKPMADVRATSEPTLPGMTIASLGGRKPVRTISDALDELAPRTSILIPVAKEAPKGTSIADIGKLPPIAKTAIQQTPRLAALGGHSLSDLFKGEKITREGEDAVEHIRRARQIRANEEGVEAAVERPAEEAFRKVYTHELLGEESAWPRISDTRGADNDLWAQAINDTNKDALTIDKKMFSPKELYDYMVRGVDNPKLAEVRVIDPLTKKRVALSAIVERARSAERSFDPEAAFTAQNRRRLLDQELKTEHNTHSVNQKVRDKIETFVEAGRAAGVSDDILQELVEYAAHDPKMRKLHQLGESRKLKKVTAYQEAAQAAKGEELTAKELRKIADEALADASSDIERAAAHFLQALLDAKVPAQKILESFQKVNFEQMYLPGMGPKAKGFLEKAGQQTPVGSFPARGAVQTVKEMLEHSDAAKEIAVETASKDPDLAADIMKPLVEPSHLAETHPERTLDELDNSLIDAALSHAMSSVDQGKFGSGVMNENKIRNAVGIAIDNLSKEKKFVESSHIVNQAKWKPSAESLAKPGTRRLYNKIVIEENRAYAKYLMEFEDRAMAMGGKYMPQLSKSLGGGYVRLSNILNALPPSLKAVNNGIEPRYRDILDSVLGNKGTWEKTLAENPAIRALVDEGQLAKKMVDKTKVEKTADVAADAVKAETRSPAAQREVGEAAKKAGKKELDDANLDNPQAGKSAVDDAVDSELPPLPKDAPSSQKAAFDGSNSRKARTTANRALSDGEKSMAWYAQAEKTGGKAWQATQETFEKLFGRAFITRFPTMPGLRTLQLEKIGSAHFFIAHRAGNLKVIHDSFSADELREAFQVVISKGTLGASSARVEEAAKALQGEFEFLYSSAGISKNGLKGSTVAVANGLDMHSMNHYLARVGYRDKFQFTDVKAKVNGIERDYSGEGQWLNSWEAVKDVDEPLELLHYMNVAVEQAMAERQLYGNVAADFASKVRTGSHTVEVNHPFLHGMYFTAEHAKALNTMIKEVEAASRGSSGFAKFMDQVMRSWKTSVTIYIPSHHIRNFIGDMYLAWQAGMNDPRYVTKARSVMRSNKFHYSDLANSPLDKLEEQRAFLRIYKNEGRMATPEELANSHPKLGDKALTVKIKGKAGEDLTAQQVHVLAAQNGMLPHANIIEDIPGSWSGTPSLTEKFKPLGGNVGRGVRKVAESREHTVRLAHFMHALEKGGPYSSLEEAVIKASAEVRKWHPDGSDLTNFERHTLRRVIPFYSWQRKATPLLFESALRNPGKTAAYFKVQNNLQVAAGVEGTSPGDPFPIDEEYPSWIRAIGVGPSIGGLIVNPSNPFADMFNTYSQNPLRGAAAQVAPFYRVPAELTFDEDVRTGAPIQDTTQYLDKQIPGLSTVNRGANADFGLSSLQGEHQTAKQAQQGFGDPNNILNILFAAGIINPKEYEKQAQFESKERAADESAERKAFFVKKGLLNPNERLTKEKAAQLQAILDSRR